MATTSSFVLPMDWTMADLQSHLGGIPLRRIRMYPPPGMATENDILEAKRHAGRICELVDGVLVEKTVGYFESRIAVVVAHLIESFLETHNLGIVLGEAGTLRLLPNQVRIPDVCFLRWERFPNRQLPREPIPSLVPDLAVEIYRRDTEQRCIASCTTTSRRECNWSGTSIRRREPHDPS